MEEYVRAERDQSVKEARRWCMVVRETKRKIELERILQKETFRRCKLEMKGELEKQLEAGEGREALGGGEDVEVRERDVRGGDDN